MLCLHVIYISLSLTKQASGIPSIKVGERQSSDEATGEPLMLITFRGGTCPCRPRSGGGLVELGDAGGRCGAGAPGGGGGFTVLHNDVAGGHPLCDG